MLHLNNNQFEHSLPQCDCRPTLKISRDEIRKQYRAFNEGFPGRVSFAVKANSHQGVLKALSECGMSNFDVASVEEIEMVKRANPKAVLHYHNPIKSRDEIQQAIEIHGCRRFSVDHLDELEKIAELVPLADKSIEIAVRFRLDAPIENSTIQAFDSKFGATPEEAARILKLVAERGFSAGLTFHPGSQTQDPQSYVRHIEAASRIQNSAGIILDFLNVGGGFPTHYKGLKFPELDVFFNAISIAYKHHFDIIKTSLECEPGRALVAGAGTLITSVKATRRDRQELYLNDGIYGGLMEVSQFPDLQPEYAAPTCQDWSHNIEWTVYGPTCDPIDVLPKQLSLPADLKEGDRIEFKGTGAYSLSTATRFNGFGDLKVEFK